MSQNTVFAQVVKLIPRTQFPSWVFKHDGDKGRRTLDCWTWFGSLLFGQLSDHASIRKFLGTSVKAVKAQILVALIAYLLVQMIRHAVKGTTSIPETMAVLATMLLLKLHIMRLLEELHRTTSYQPDRKLALPL